jgi:hypothetical protein
MVLRDALTDGYGDDAAGEQMDSEALGQLRALRQHEAELATDFAAARAKWYFDRRHTQHQFAVNDKVYLRLHCGYKVLGQAKKFGQQRVGPLRVTEVVNPHAYRLDLPAHWRIHPVVSILQLERAPNADDPYERPPVNEHPPVHMEGDDDEWHSYEIESLAARRTRRNRYQYLVRWVGYGREHDEWYDEDLLTINANELVQRFGAQALRRNARGEEWPVRGERRTEEPQQREQQPRRGRGRPRRRL